MEDKFSYLKDIEDYQSFNVKNKKALRKILMEYERFNFKTTTSYY